MRAKALWRASVKRAIVINALGIALVVGSLLNAINHGASLWAGTDIAWGQIFLNYLVPYCVATYSAAKNELDRRRP